jgi:hypothetical protein
MHGRGQRSAKFCGADSYRLCGKKSSEFGQNEFVSMRSAFFSSSEGAETTQYQKQGLPLV